MTASLNSPPNSDSPAALSGLRVLVTRAQNQADELTVRLSQEGATVYALPFLEFQAPQDCAELDVALQKLSAFDWLIFASKNAVEFTFSRLEKLAQKGLLKSSPDVTIGFPHIAVIGSGTARALEAHKLKADFIPPAFVAESLVEQLPQAFPLKEKKILWLKTNIGRPLIKTELEKSGASVTAVTVYETNLPTNSLTIGRILLELLKEDKIDVITVASAQTARNLAKVLGQSLAENYTTESNNAEPTFPSSSSSAIDAEPTFSDNLSPASETNSIPSPKSAPSPAATSATTDQPLTPVGLLEKVMIAAIGPITARACLENLGKADLVASEYNLDGLVNLLATFQAKNHETLGINKNQITI
jgi:uroporphyrinogen-III synthase